MPDLLNPKNIHAEKGRKNKFLAFGLIIFFGGIAAVTIIFNILTRG